MYRLFLFFFFDVFVSLHLTLNHSAHPRQQTTHSFFSSLADNLIHGRESLQWCLGSGNYYNGAWGQGIITMRSWNQDNGAIESLELAVKE